MYGTMEVLSDNVNLNEKIMVLMERGAGKKNQTVPKYLTKITSIPVVIVIFDI